MQNFKLWTNYLKKEKSFVQDLRRSHLIAAKGVRPRPKDQKQ